MLSCAAFLRVYEPLSAFGAAERAYWAAYAAREGRPRRAKALEAEQLMALRRITALPPIVAPAEESGDAYVRWADGVTYVCPWQSRLRSLLALRALQGIASPLLAWVGDAGGGEPASGTAGRRGRAEESPRVYIQSSSWTVPSAWFVPFAPTERWLVVGSAGNAGGRGSATAATTRTLIYATSMAQARRRVARALAAVRRAAAEVRPDQQGGCLAAAPRAAAEVEAVGRWLEEFHPHSLVELDYGGLVQVIDDDALRADQSVAEAYAAVSALARKEFELAAAMYRQLRSRWQDMEARQFRN